MDATELETLQKAGANARALGRSELGNPYYRAENMPAVTGETKDLWLEKLEAWHLGWTIENAMRP